MLQKYIDYLKDNPQNLWFKRKIYGWGWTPVKWQGWVTILIFILFLLWNGFNLGETPTNSDILWFFGRLIFAIIILFIICYKKGETPRWQWGLPDKEN